MLLRNFFQFSLSIIHPNFLSFYGFIIATITKAKVMVKVKVLSTFSKLNPARLFRSIRFFEHENDA